MPETVVAAANEAETLARARVRQSMAALLNRAGLSYQGGFVQAGRSRVHYLDYGDGPPVVLVHGAGEGGAIWYRQIACLSRRFRVIAPDNPVFGLSDQTVLREPMYDFASRYLGAFLDALRLDSVRMAGHSLGGLAALSLAIEQPGRIDRLALIDSMGFGKAMPVGVRLASVRGLGWIFRRPGRRMQRLTYRSMGMNGGDTRDMELLTNFAYDVTRVPRHPGAKLAGLRSLTNLRGQLKVFTDSELASIRVPTMIIWGQDDRYFPPSHAYRAHKIMEGSELHVIPEASHVPFWDQPQRVAQLLERFFSD